MFAHAFSTVSDVEKVWRSHTGDVEDGDPAIARVPAFGSLADEQYAVRDRPVMIYVSVSASTRLMMTEILMPVQDQQ